MGCLVRVLVWARARTPARTPARTSVPALEVRSLRYRPYSTRTRTRIVQAGWPRDFPFLLFLCTFTILFGQCNRVRYEYFVTFMGKSDWIGLGRQGTMMRRRATGQVFKKGSFGAKATNSQTTTRHTCMCAKSNKKSKTVHKK